MEDLLLLYRIRPDKSQVSTEFFRRFDRFLKAVQLAGIRTLGDLRIQEDSAFLDRMFRGNNREERFKFMKEAFKKSPENEQDIIQ